MADHTDTGSRSHHARCSPPATSPLAASSASFRSALRPFSTTQACACPAQMMCSTSSGCNSVVCQQRAFGSSD
eukprot:10878966-Alexandrium_andersonii.AAC.1